MSLLQMGDGNDGVGRLEMRGKICEVKAATPKGEGVYNPKKGRQGNIGTAANKSDNTDFHSRNHPPGYSQSNAMLAHPHMVQMGYPMTLDPLAGPVAVHNPYFYPNGYPTYGIAQAPYYSGMIPPQHFGMHPLDPSIAYGSAGASSIIPQYDQAMASHYFPVHNQHHLYVPINPTSLGTDLGAAAATSMQTSVMQPVAPGIPRMEDDNKDSLDDTNIENAQQ